MRIRAVFRTAIIVAIVAMMSVTIPNLNSAPANFLVADVTGLNGQNIVAMSNTNNTLLETANVSIAYEQTPNIYVYSEVRANPPKFAGLSGTEQTKAYGQQPFRETEEYPLKISSFNQTSIVFC